MIAIPTAPIPMRVAVKRFLGLTASGSGAASVKRLVFALCALGLLRESLLLARLALLGRLHLGLAVGLLHEHPPARPAERPDEEHDRVDLVEGGHDQLLAERVGG